MRITYDAYQSMLNLLKQHFQKNSDQTITIKDLKFINQFDTSGELSKVFEHAIGKAGLRIVNDQTIQQKLNQLRTQQTNINNYGLFMNDNELDDRIETLIRLQQQPVLKRGIYVKTEFDNGATDFHGIVTNITTTKLKPLNLNALIDRLQADVNFEF